MFSILWWDFSCIYEWQQLQQLPPIELWLIQVHKIKFISTAVLGGTVAFLWNSTNVRLHLPVVGEHDEEEVGGKHPAGKVDRHVQEGEAEGCLAHIEKIQDQTDAIENQPRLHVASIFLKKEPFKEN